MNIKAGNLRFILVTLATLLMAIQLQAQVNWLTDNRYVTVSGYGQIPSAGVSSNYSATAIPSTSFAAFNGSISGEAYLQGGVFTGTQPNMVDSYATATQTSSLAGDQFDFNSGINVYTGGLGYDQQVLCYGESDSYCQLTFSVNSPQTWNLSVGFVGSLPYGGPRSSVSWDLTSVQNGSVLGALTENSQNSDEPYLYQGTLMPGDTYSLSLSLHAYDNQPVSIGDDAGGGVIATFSVVPEPSSYALMVIGLITLYSLQKKSFIS
jgi:hypothetical protein